MNEETWIVVADGARARLFSHLTGQSPPLQSALDHDLVAPRVGNAGLETDKPGRTNARTVRMRHAVVTHIDSQRHAQIELARAVARELDAARCRGVGSFVLVAPPRALGDLREACNGHVRALVRDELPKDLSRMPVHELVTALADVLDGSKGPR